MEFFSFLAWSLAGLALVLAVGRALLALLPAGVPGGGSPAERPGVLAASLVLGIVALGSVDRLGGGPLALGLVSLAPPALVGLRRALGPAAMRPRRPLRAPRPTSGAERAGGLALGLLAAVIVAARGLGPRPHLSWLGGSEASFALDLERVDLEALALYSILAGLLSLWGLGRGLGAAARRGLVAAASALLWLVARPLGAVLAPLVTEPGARLREAPEPLAEVVLVALLGAALLLALFRRRAERRCLVLAPLVLLLPGLAVPAGYGAPAAALSAAIAAAFAWVPAASRRRALPSFAVALGLALLLGR